VADEEFRPGASGVFKAIVDSARKFKRAVTGAEEEAPDEALAIGEQIAQAFVAGRFADVHALGTSPFQQRTSRAQFVEQWSQAARARGPFTTFEVRDAGPIDVGFIPGLEEVAQDDFVAFLEIAFASPDVPIHDEKVFTVGIVLLEDGEQVRLGALHAR
jgi:hypothetical protein